MQKLFPKYFTQFHSGSKKGRMIYMTVLISIPAASRARGSLGQLDWMPKHICIKNVGNIRNEKRESVKRKRVSFSSSLATLLDNWSTVTFKLLQGKGNNWPQQTQTSATMHSWSVSEMFVAYALCICQKHLLPHCIFFYKDQRQVFGERAGRLHG